MALTEDWRWWCHSGTDRRLEGEFAGLDLGSGEQVQVAAFSFPTPFAGFRLVVECPVLQIALEKKIRGKVCGHAGFFWGLVNLDVLA